MSLRARIRHPIVDVSAVAALVVVLELGVPFCASARAVDWARPVDGAVTRPFDVHGSPFAAGRHRGVDLAARPGEAVGAPCGGRVVAAGRIGTSGRVVTIACGPWHATVMPLGEIDVRRGADVAAGRRVGLAAEGPGAHVGIHLGVRRASEEFGYVDPLRFLPRARPWAPVGPRPGRDRGRRPRPAPAQPAPRAAPAPRPAAAANPGGVVAPWPVWAGAALLLAGASGGVVRARRRPARRPSGSSRAAEAAVR